LIYSVSRENVLFLGKRITKWFINLSNNFIYAKLEKIIILNIVNFESQYWKNVLKFQNLHVKCHVSPVCEMRYGVRTLKFQNVACKFSSEILSSSSARRIVRIHTDWEWVVIMGSSHMCFKSITKAAVLLTYFFSKHSLSASSIQQQRQIEPKCNTNKNGIPFVENNGWLIRKGFLWRK